MKTTIKLIMIVGVIMIVFYFSFGFFVIQPIGAVPEGATILYVRAGLNLSFITSADGILLEKDQDVSLLARVLVLGNFAEVTKNRKIVTFPYSDALYKTSTGGVEFER